MKTVKKINEDNVQRAIYAGTGIISILSLYMVIYFIRNSKSL